MSEKIQSTRSDASGDAHRDFDDFDPDEELIRMRRAIVIGQFDLAVKLALNIDEYMTRGGALPTEWRGPPCMQSPSDMSRRFQPQ